MILPFLSQTFTHDWQVNSICCKSSPYEQVKECNDFQFCYFPFKPEKTQINIYAFLNHFNEGVVCFFLRILLTTVYYIRKLWVLLVDYRMHNRPITVEYDVLWFMFSFVFLLLFITVQYFTVYYIC